VTYDDDEAAERRALIYNSPAMLITRHQVERAEMRKSEHASHRTVGWA
jgi:hypothetical protein